LWRVKNLKIPRKYTSFSKTKQLASNLHARSLSNEKVRGDDVEEEEENTIL